MNVLLVNNNTEPKNWAALQAAIERAGYSVTPVHHSAIGAIDPRGYDFAILSGGWYYDDEVELLQKYAEELQFINTTPIPILGICVGMQLMHIAIDQAVPLMDGRQYGWEEIDVTIAGRMLFGFEEKINVFKNHDRAIIETDSQFEVLASVAGHTEIMLHKTKPLLGVQFHPEEGEINQAAIMLKTLVDALMRVASDTSVITDGTTDETWYRQLKPLMQEIGETFVALMPSDEKLHRQHDEFVASGYASLPNLYPEVPHAATLRASKTRLENLIHAVNNGEKVSARRDVYIERIKEMVGNIDMILAAKDGNAELFEKTNQIIYGLPNYSIFAAACAWVRRDAMKEHSGVSEQLRDQLLQLVPDIDGEVALLFPSDDVFQSVKELHFRSDGYVDRLFKNLHVPDDTVITSDIGDPITQGAINNIGSSFKLADSPTGLWAVLQSQRQVIRPAEYALTKEAFMGIISHEVGSHLLESTNGEKSTLRLLELGLDRYECGNEGRAFLREQIMYADMNDYIEQPSWWPTKASWEYRIAIHMIISLAVGLHGRRYNFAELYQLLTVLFRFWTVKRGQKIDENSIHQGAWSMAVRALKGTDGTGGAYLKDIVYLEGNIRCWQTAAAHPELVLYGDEGKFDIANPVHVQALTSLGILPKIF